MAIYDCVQYFNEDHILDLRFNILDKYVDYFVVSESTKTHQGQNKKLNFDIKKFPKFKDKIRYLVADFDGKLKQGSHMWGESSVEKHQRNFLIEGIKDADDNDLIILSDSDEIPDLSKINLIKSKTKYVAFSQIMFMYKLNLKNLSEKNWIGSKISKKKDITTFQKLRELKIKSYPFWRFDKRNLQIIKGGWHFSFLQNPENIALKIKSFSHGEFNIKELTDKKKIEMRVLNNQDIFNRGYKFEKVKIDENFPKYIIDNKSKFSEWIL